MKPFSLTLGYYILIFLVLRALSLPSSPSPYQSGRPLELGGQPPLTSSGRADDWKAVNFALSLEHLLSAFFGVGVNQFSDSDFQDSGYPQGTRDRYADILANEQAHVDIISSTLQSEGATLIGACEYDFPMNTVHDFVDLSQAISALAVSTYAGIMSRLTSGSYVGMLASMLAVEGRHSVWISTSLKGETPWNTPFETPTTFNHTWSIAKIYVTSCPPGNNPETTLPPNLTNIPVLSIDSHVAPGQHIKVDFADDLHTAGRPIFAAFLIGISYILVPLEVGVNGERWLNVPQDLGGTGAVWVVIVQALEADELPPVADENTVAGPALVLFSSGGQGDRPDRPNAWSW